MVTKSTKKKVEPKKTVAKAPKKVAQEKKESLFEGKYFYAVGKRKTAIAQVRIYPKGKKEISTLINGKNLETYFPLKRLSGEILAPFVACGQENQFSISVKVKGGGINAQAEAIRLGVARALVIFEEANRKSLRVAGFLTRDARKVERKKPGKKKARKSPQWAKR